MVWWYHQCRAARRRDVRCSETSKSTKVTHGQTEKMRVLKFLQCCVSTPSISSLLPKSLIMAFLRKNSSWITQVIVSLFLIVLAATDVLAFPLLHSNNLPLPTMMRALWKQGVSSSWAASKSPYSRLGLVASPIAGHGPRTFTVAHSMSTKGDTGEQEWVPPSPFKPGQKIQVEILSFGPLGASVVRASMVLTLRGNT